MGWIEDLQDKIFEIVTGDGKSYFPKWKNAIKEQEYNVTVYDFIGVEGSFVDRKKPKGRKFALEFYFDGEEAVNLGNNFELSARDNRKWLLKHPFYGDIYCHPLGLKQNNAILNTSRFTVTVIETLPEGYPDYNTEFADVIIEQQDVINEAQIEAFESSDTIDRNSLRDLTEQVDAVFSAMIDDENDLNEFKALVDSATTDLNNLTTSATVVMRSVVDLINYPATIAQTVTSRFTAFKEVLGDLVENLGLIDVGSRSVSQKVEFETIAGTIVTAMMVASTSELDDSYLTRTEVIDQQEELIQAYDDYLEVLDDNQTDRNDTEDSYTPVFESVNEIAQIVSLTVSNLYAIAFEAKQERIYITEKDSNAVLLCHKFYGLDKEDENLDNFIETNKIGINELLNIKKGRELIYYV